MVISSIIYRMRRDGRAMRIRMTAGKIVHTISTPWASTVLVWVSLVESIREMT